MKSSHDIPVINIYSNEFLTMGVDFYLANVIIEEEKLHLINLLAISLVDSLNIQRNDTAKSLQIASIAKHIRYFIDTYLNQVENIEVRVKLLFNLGSHYSRNSELQLAKDSFEQAMKIFEAHNLTNQELLSNILQTYGTTNIRLENDDQAIHLLGQSLQLKKELFSPDIYDANGFNAIHHTAISYSSAFLFSKKSVEEKAQAMPILMDAVNHFEKEFQNNKPHSGYLAYQVAEGYMLIGHYYRLIADFPKAEEYLNKSLAIYNTHNHFKNGHIDKVRVHNFIGLVHAGQGNDEIAKVCFQQAVNAKLHDKNHHLYQTYYHLHLLAKKTNLEEAYEYLRRSVLLMQSSLWRKSS